MHSPDKNRIPESWRSHDKGIAPYLWSHRILSWSKTGIFLTALLYLLNSHKLAELEWTLNSVTTSMFLKWLLYFAILGLGSEMISLPFGMAHHRVEIKFQLSKQSYFNWVKDRAKGWLLGIILGTLTMGILYFCVHQFEKLWWVGACTLLVLLSVVLAQLTPVLLIPIFFKLKPMEDGVLKERLLKMCEKFRVHVKEVYHLGLGEKTEKGNAAFVGLGKTKRIIIGDTLYQKFSADEVEAVFAHELGHQVHNDLWKGIIFSSLFMYLGFFLANWICDAYLFGRLDTSIQSPYGLLLFFIVMSLVQMPMGALQSAFSRWREREADRFAADTTGTGPKLADALERLTIQNRGQFKPNCLVEAFTHSHPAPWRRILSLR